MKNYIIKIDFLNQYHENGFWKNYNHKNWDLDSREMQKGKYIGLQNMSSTCYLNSIYSTIIYDSNVERNNFKNK